MSDDRTEPQTAEQAVTDIEMEALRNGLGWLEQCQDQGQYVHPDVISDMRIALEAIEKRRMANAAVKE